MGQGQGGNGLALRPGRVLSLARRAASWHAASAARGTRETRRARAHADAQRLARAAPAPAPTAVRSLALPRGPQRAPAPPRVAGAWRAQRRAEARRRPRARRPRPRPRAARPPRRRRPLLSRAASARGTSPAGAMAAVSAAAAADALAALGPGAPGRSRRWAAGGRQACARVRARANVRSARGGGGRGVGAWQHGGHPKAAASALSRPGAPHVPRWQPPKTRTEPRAQPPARAPWQGEAALG